MYNPAFTFASRYAFPPRDFFSFQRVSPLTYRRIPLFPEIVYTALRFQLLSTFCLQTVWQRSFYQILPVSLQCCPPCLSFLFPSVSRRVINRSFLSPDSYDPRKREHEGFVKSFRRVCPKLVYPQLFQGFRRQTGYMRCQFGRQVNRCQAVSTADNADSSCLRF